MLGTTSVFACLLALGAAQSYLPQLPQPVYFPLRPPALPLAVRGPYTSAWTSTAGNGTLNTAGASFWTGDSLGWEGIVTVDGISYEYLGTGSQSLPELPNFKSATPLSVRYDSQYSNFTFSAGPVEVTASFFSPVIPKDLCRTSIPLSYLITSVKSTDGAAHDVKLYSDVNAAWITYEYNKTVTWSLHESGISKPVNGSNATITAPSIFSWLLQLKDSYTFAENNQFPEWGNFTYSSSEGSARNFSFESGFSGNLRYKFINRHGLSNIVDSDYRGAGEREPAFAFAHDLGSVRTGSVVYTIGTIQQPAMRYLTSSGLTALQPWWTKCYGDIYQLIQFHYKDLKTSQALGAAFEAQLKADINQLYGVSGNGSLSSKAGYIGTLSAPWMYTNTSRGTDQFGNQYVFDSRNAYGFLDPHTYEGIAIPDVSEAASYYSIVALSARQIMGAYVLTVSPHSSDPLMFQKEISSDGNVNTVDVMYPAMPFFLYANPALLKYNLDPLFQNQEGGFYPNGYSMHDLGTNFPNATGHVEGNDEYMPVEESGNMILMTLAYSQFAGDKGYLSQHYNQMHQWAKYLLEFSLIPETQLSTDDFAGQLVNQTNLAVKGIVAIGAMAEIAKTVGASSDAANFSATATKYINKWEKFAVDPSEKHTLLAYEWRSSWGLLYNIYPDKLLGLGVVPAHIYEMQSNWYPQVSQIFGVPLDSRHFYTKSDWEMWTAATCEPATRRLFVDAIAYWLNETTTSLAFTDLYDTVGTGDYPNDDSGNPIQFIARPVQGGQFALLALAKKPNST
ncbi:Glutaminase GtaA [Rasamsonia emersonii CBS 393.64]|uniref:Glutaminase GtaA n=1 Tax=Rasamsonia emersonii (strain ATCC 16479 / CBS 393.64 / IMI 116815) TaxID=1408163 RepID=A0A0F4YU61_RASE3|nr:Glutaminase GtaA [Rasamsonia emersonii CBS 393.64]KKA21769.1 Glutaminase GtaA [Rasamsonia emersonii CBS 393.64]